MENLSDGRLTVAHVDDDPMWCDVVARIIAETPDARYLGRGSTIREGVALCRAKQPDLTLVDLWLPDGDGFRLGEELNRSSRSSRVLFLSCRTDDVTLYRAWSGGGAGLVWKTPQTADHLRAALASIAAGRRYFPTDVLAAISRFRSSPEAFFKILSPREQSLIEAFVRGDTDDEIAQPAGLSRHTVHQHRKNIMAKLNLHDRRDLMRWGAERGFNTPLGAGFRMTG